MVLDEAVLHPKRRTLERQGLQLQTMPGKENYHFKNILDLSQLRLLWKPSTFTTKYEPQTGTTMEPMGNPAAIYRRLNN